MSIPSTIIVGDAPNDVTISQDRRRAYIINADPDPVSVIDIGPG